MSKTGHSTSIETPPTLLHPLPIQRANVNADQWICNKQMSQVRECYRFVKPTLRCGNGEHIGAVAIFLEVSQKRRIADILLECGSNLSRNFNSWSFLTEVGDVIGLSCFLFFGVGPLTAKRGRKYPCT